MRSIKRGRGSGRGVTATAAGVKRSLGIAADVAKAAADVAGVEGVFSVSFRWPRGARAVYMVHFRLEAKMRLVQL